jgi:hypothetical protein
MKRIKQGKARELSKLNRTHGKKGRHGKIKTNTTK